jgi:signal transduction histidine kinase
MPIESATDDQAASYAHVAAALTRHSGADPFGQLLGQIAHDFNNLLSVAITGSEVAQSFTQDARVTRFLGTSLGALQGGQRLTSRLASVSQTRYCAERVDVGILVEALREVMRSRLGVVCAIDVQLGAHNHIVLTDALMLGVALLNLADNAREAMPGGGRWTLSTRNEVREGLANPGSYLIIGAADSGDGWAQHARMHAFDLFFSTKSEERGLGLAQVRDLTRRCGGFVQIDGEEGRGVQLRVALPLAEPA